MIAPVFETVLSSLTQVRSRGAATLARKHRNTKSYAIAGVRRRDDLTTHA